jgi:hypothetical protein
MNSKFYINKIAKDIMKGKLVLGIYFSGALSSVNRDQKYLNTYSSQLRLKLERKL